LGFFVVSSTLSFKDLLFEFLSLAVKVRLLSNIWCSNRESWLIVPRPDVHEFMKRSIFMRALHSPLFPALSTILKRKSFRRMTNDDTDQFPHSWHLLSRNGHRHLQICFRENVREAARRWMRYVNRIWRKEILGGMGSRIGSQTESSWQSRPLAIHERYARNIDSAPHQDRSTPSRIYHRSISCFLKREMIRLQNSETVLLIGNNCMTHSKLGHSKEKIVDLWIEKSKLRIFNWTMKNCLKSPVSWYSSRDL
jgi:hypothetical protein